MADDDRLVRDLARPESYPPPRPHGVTSIVTHISWVFLTDDTVWKVKRPVDLGFVNYADVDRRHHYCQEEVRLNRRLAGDIYDGVAPVKKGAQGFTFHGEGTVVDYAVKMRRLNDDDSALALLRGGTLSHGHLSKLAARLGAFFSNAAEVPEFGKRDVYDKNVEDNLTALRPFADVFIDLSRFEIIAEAQRAAVDRFKDDLTARVLGGRIRDGHGDLRLEHVYFPASRPDPVVIDCVEFNEAFRCADVALDIAFFATELAVNGRPDLAAYFAYRFARETDDYDFYPLLDFYVTYRALIRAKIACLLTSDPHQSADKVRRKRLEAERFLRLAHAVVTAKKAPRVVVVGGLTGTGKSTLAETLAVQMGVPVISSDRVRKYLAGIPATARGPDSLYDADSNARTYQEILRRAEQVLRSGRTVVLDATFRSRDLRTQARRIAAVFGAPFCFVELTCAESVIRQRLTDREKKTRESDAGTAVYEELRHDYTPAEDLPPDERLVLDAQASPEVLADRVRAAFFATTQVLSPSR